MLAGFAKLQQPLAPGEAIVLPVSFSAEALATWDPELHEYTMEKSMYDLTFGEDSVTERGSAAFTIS